MGLKPLSQCDMEELAAYQRTAEPSGGVMFARNTERNQKELARDRLIELFAMEAWSGHLHILTMPGLDWRFERKLLGHRECGWTVKLEWPKHTRIVSIENDRSIYYSAVANMPGAATRNALISIRSPANFAEFTVKTKFIKRFHFGNVDDLMRDGSHVFDAAWLDYTGPMTVDRLKLISAFYRLAVRHTLIVTMLRGRWNKQAGEAIAKAGGHSEWLSKGLPGEVLHYLEYNDSSPMAQFAVRKET